MRYMLMLFEGAHRSFEDNESEMERHNTFMKLMKERNIPIVDGNALLSPDHAKTLRPGTDGVLVTDGPYVELKDYLGGYHVIDAQNLDAALDAAKTCPMYAGTEIRPVWEMPS